MIFSPWCPFVFPYWQLFSAYLVDEFLTKNWYLSSVFPPYVPSINTPRPTPLFLVNYSWPSYYSHYDFNLTPPDSPLVPWLYLLRLDPTGVFPFFPPKFPPFLASSDTYIFPFHTISFFVCSLLPPPSSPFFMTPSPTEHSIRRRRICLFMVHTGRCYDDFPFSSNTTFPPSPIFFRFLCLC